MATTTPTAGQCVDTAGLIAGERGLIDFTAALIKLRQQIPALVGDHWWEEGDGNVRWLNRHAQPLSADEWQHGPMQMQILLSDRFLIAINAALDAAEIVLPEGEWRAVPLCRSG